MTNDSRCANNSILTGRPPVGDYIVQTEDSSSRRTRSSTTASTANGFSLGDGDQTCRSATTRPKPCRRGTVGLLEHADRRLRHRRARPANGGKRSPVASLRTARTWTSTRCCARARWPMSWSTPNWTRPKVPRSRGWHDPEEGQARAEAGTRRGRRRGRQRRPRLLARHTRGRDWLQPARPDHDGGYRC